MTQQNPILLNQLRADYEAIKQIGSPILGCQGMLVPRGMEEYRFLIKTCPRPIVSNGDPAEVQYAGGFTGIVAGVPQTKFSGGFSIIETEAGHAQLLAEYIVNSGGMIDCDYYDGRIGNFTRAYELLNCAMRFEPTDFDTENRSQGMIVSGTMDYNFFGSFATIGSNGTVAPGQKSVAGIQDLVSRVQNVTSAVSGIANTIGSISRTASAVKSLFG
ncbi:hypothetical protein F965_00503 [Acinetobacter schindleri NIPH 900]|uniref:Uncharacterized protein n=1 Tax=Acinetobacter schindleri NIPH 900 TaxID=1217675 RepID=N8Y4M0_9GAMM|nr:hypothetical protein [Acinetobacter schindleri]ENV14260.1 hypothetical protein F965_00503 [Acinetobacter schindleri NIPH 900]